MGWCEVGGRLVICQVLNDGVDFCEYGVVLQVESWNIVFWVDGEIVCFVFGGVVGEINFFDGDGNVGFVGYDVRCE